MAGLFCGIQRECAALNRKVDLVLQKVALLKGGRATVPGRKLWDNTGEEAGTFRAERSGTDAAGKKSDF